jgi:hypothetical protein
MDKNMLAKNVFYINLRHYDSCCYEKYIFQASTGLYRPIQDRADLYRHFKNMKISYIFYNNINHSVWGQCKNVFSQHIVVPFCYKMLSSGFWNAYTSLYGPVRACTGLYGTYMSVWYIFLIKTWNIVSGVGVETVLNLYRRSKSHFHNGFNFQLHILPYGASKICHI